MTKLIGIGGVFIYAENPQSLAEWYSRYLGFTFESMAEEGQSPTYYQPLPYRDINDPDKILHTVFAIMPARQKLGDVRNQAMINYCIDDIDGLVKQLTDTGITVDSIETWADGGGNGKFTHFYDPEGNRIELWQPIDG